MKHASGTRSALECLHRALDLSPEHLPSLRHAQRLAEKLGRWRDLVGLLEREAAQVSDLKQIVALRHRAAEVLDERLSDASAAVVAYEKLLAVSPAYLPALTALGRLYAESGRWADLASLHRTEAAVAPPERAAHSFSRWRDSGTAPGRYRRRAGHLWASPGTDAPGPPSAGCLGSSAPKPPGLGITGHGPPPRGRPEDRPA